MVYGYGNLNYKDRLSLLELPSLEEGRVKGDLIEAFKLLKGIALLICINDMVYVGPRQ